MTFKWAPVLRRYLRVWRESNFSFFPCVRALGGEGAANEKNGTRLAPNIYVYARLLIFSVQNRAERVQASSKLPRLSLGPPRPQSVYSAEQWCTGELRARHRRARATWK